MNWCCKLSVQKERSYVKAVTGSKAIILEKISEYGHEKSDRVIENGQHGTVKQNPEVQLNSSMETIFCLVFA